MECYLKRTSHEKVQGEPMNIPVQFALVAGLALASVSASAASSLQMNSLASSCANCHGTSGVAQPGMESLAGKPKDDLLKKMMDFKSGKKPATIMHQLSKGYTDEQLEQLAAHFAAMPK
jgi:cytochrome subunit of sulfide dehydrogenase